MTSPIEQVVEASQQQHRTYYGLYGQSPASGSGLRDLGGYSRRLSADALDVRHSVQGMDFSTYVGSGFSRDTGRDHLPADKFGGAADDAGNAADTSAQINADGSNQIASNANAEAAEIAAVPDPQSPAGQAQILAIIQKYQAKSAGTVEGSTTSEQTAGAKAADDSSSSHDHGHSKDDNSDSSGSGSGGLMDILDRLLGSAGGGMGSGSGMDPMSQMGQQNPFGANPYGMNSASPGTATPAANPFADVPGTSSSSTTPGTTQTGYNSSVDPFASVPSTGTEGTDDGKNGKDGKDGTNSGNTTSTSSSGVAPGTTGTTTSKSNTQTSSNSAAGGLDLSEFGEVPKDPGTA